MGTLVDEMVTELYRISLVDLDKDGDPSMHSLIKAFIQTKIAERGPLQRQLSAILREMVLESGEDQGKLGKVVPHTVFIFHSLSSDTDDLPRNTIEAMGLAVPLVSSALRQGQGLVTSARKSCTEPIAFLEGFRKPSPSLWTAELQLLLAGAFLNLGNTYTSSLERDSALTNYSRSIDLCMECEADYGYIPRCTVLRSIAQANRAQILLNAADTTEGLLDVNALLAAEQTNRQRLGPDWPISDHNQLARSLGNLLDDVAKCRSPKLTLKLRQLLISIVEASSKSDWAILNSVGVMHLQDGEWDAAEAVFRRCSEAAANVGSDEGSVKSRNNLSISLRKQGRLPEAEDVAAESVQLASRIGEMAWEYQSLGTLANILMDQRKRSQEDGARARIREIRRIIGDEGDDGLVTV
jgi:tetratricopeptide (TPR) repeat protein